MKRWYRFRGLLLLVVAEMERTDRQTDGRTDGRTDGHGHTHTNRAPRVNDSLASQTYVPRARLLRASKRGLGGNIPRIFGQVFV